jgi:2-haloacid dehalogenase
MALSIGFDVYGTLVDPLGIAGDLRPIVGDLTDRLVGVWRTKQLEYTFRRAAMHRYEKFGVCTREALIFAERSLGMVLDDATRNRIVARYESLPAYADSLPGLTAIRNSGCRMFAFSNGEPESLRKLLAGAGLLAFLDGVVSVDEVGSYKPDPAVYRHFLKRAGTPANDTWLVSSNSFDVIGAAAAGLRTAWIKRDVSAVLDPWEIAPDLIVPHIGDLAARLAGGLTSG